MKKTFTRLFASMMLAGSLAASAQAPVPELLYYRFNGTGTSVPNEALTPPVGTTTATIMGGQTQGSSGQCGGALIGTGTSSTNDYVNTGWATNLNGTSWTLSFWTSNVPQTTSTYYILGDVNAGGFRVFTGGVAGSGNWILRGGFTDVLATGGASTGPTLTTFVYDMPNNQIRSYVNGVLNQTVAQAGVSIAGSGPFKVGGYSSSASLPSTSLMDEFRLYNRALSVAEIQSLMITSTSSTLSVASCTSVYTAPSGATFTTAGTYMDTIPNVNGCDSIITLNLTFTPPVTSSMSVTSCDNYTAPSGAMYNTSGTYMDTISTVSGCDSVITIALTITNSTASTIYPSTCNTYTSPSGMVLTSTGYYNDVIPNAAGCDSTIAIVLTILPNTSNTVNPTVCDNYTAPSGAVFTASGTYYDTIANMNGCDSITTINLTVNMSTSAAMSAAVCSSFTAPSGAVFTSSGVYMDTILNASGCDSILTITLQVNQSFATIAPVSCDSFVSPGGTTYFASGTYMDTLMNAAGCDSVITINLTIGTPSTSTLNATACNSYTAPSGAVYTSSGTYTDVIPNATGCDSTITISLVLNSANTATTQNGAVLSAVATGATYQWVSCPSMTPIAGATGQTFTAVANGDYAVIVTENSCSDTSACLNVTGIGITENGFGSALNVYPNPSTGVFFVDLGATYTDVSVVVSDITGRVVSAQLVNSANIIPVTVESPAGVYMITITTPGNSAVIKVVKE